MTGQSYWILTLRKTLPGLGMKDDVPMNDQVSAIVLAAGESRRMGIPKMTLPWDDSTVIEHVVSVLEEAGVSEIIVVTGGAQAEVTCALEEKAVRIVNNAGFAAGEMLSSFQAGLAVAEEGRSPAVLVVLGDQPQIQRNVVSKILARWLAARSPIIVPSYQMHKGHPWLLRRSLWSTIPGLQAPDTLHSFLSEHSDMIDYLIVDTATILLDLDTPTEYQNQRPKT